MDYSFLRQKIVSQNIRNLKQKYIDSDIGTDQDPFQVYHYPKMAISEQAQQEIYSFIKGEVKKEINSKKFSEINEKMREEEYILDKIIETQQLQLSSINMVVQRLDQTIQQNFKVSPEQIAPKIKSTKSCQTNYIQNKQDSQQCDIGTKIQKDKERQRELKNICIKVPAYSISINQEKKEKQNSHTQERLKGNDLKKTVKYSSSFCGGQGTKGLYSQLQRQMAYLEYLKNDRVQYSKQKKKVKFLMQLFWKNAKS